MHLLLKGPKYAFANEGMQMHNYPKPSLVSLGTGLTLTKRQISQSALTVQRKWGLLDP
jgi:hypothetical protein